MNVVLIGGYPKGFHEAFHIKTKSGKVLRGILNKLDFKPVLFNLWKNQEEENARVLKDFTKKQLNEFIKNDFVLIALGRYIEKSLRDNQFDCYYLPHPASRNIKDIKTLEKGLLKLSSLD